MNPDLEFTVWVIVFAMAAMFVLLLLYPILYWREQPSDSAKMLPPVASLGILAGLFLLAALAESTGGVL